MCTWRSFKKRSAISGISLVLSTWVVSAYTPKMPGCSMVWEAPVPTKRAGRSALMTASGVCE